MAARGKARLPEAEEARRGRDDVSQLRRLDPERLQERGGVLQLVAVKSEELRAAREHVAHLGRQVWVSEGGDCAL